MGASGKILIESENGYEYTDYDGDGDYYESSDSVLKISGAQTWCLEIKIDSAQVGYDGQVGNFGPDGAIRRGLYLLWNTGLIRFGIGDGGSGEHQIELAVDLSEISDEFVKVVAVYDGGAINNSSMNVYYNGSWHTGIVTTLNTAAFATPTVNFFIGRRGWLPETINADIKNVEIYSGEATSPTSWVPGDTDSLAGTTLVMASANGSGQDNDESLTFTKNGDPEQKYSSVINDIKVAGVSILNAINIFFSDTLENLATAVKDSINTKVDDYTAESAGSDIIVSKGTDGYGESLVVTSDSLVLTNSAFLSDEAQSGRGRGRGR